MVGRLAMMTIGVAIGTITPTNVLAQNGIIARQPCDSSTAISVRYAGSSRRVYVENADGRRGGCATMTDIYNAIKHRTDALIPIYPSNSSEAPYITGTWLLSEDLYVVDGVTLNVIGASGGDCQELRLLSGAANHTVVNLRAHGGNLNFQWTKVTSWDTQTHSPDMRTDMGRSYISAISEVITDKNETCIGTAKTDAGEARMDIEHSEMAYLGWFDSESYGLVWKVRGFCANKSNKQVFDRVAVYGNIYDSNIHHNYFGHYSYGHQGGDWRRNKMWGNVQYGFDPHDNSDNLNIHDNEVYDNGNHGIIASVECNGLSIQNNTVYNGKQAGIFLHRSSNDAIVKGNKVYGNEDAGIAFLESNNALVTENELRRNKYGIRLSVGSAHNRFSYNIIHGSSQYAVFTYVGSDPTWVAPSGKPTNNKFAQNDLWCEPDTTCIKLTGAEDTVITGNRIKNLQSMIFSNSTGTVFRDNNGYNATNVAVKVTGGSCFNTQSDSQFSPKC